MRKGLETVRNKLIFFFNTACSALLFIFSFSEKGLDFLIWFSLVPIFFEIFARKTGNFKKGLLIGTVIYTASIIWLAPTISKYGGLPFISAFSAILLLGTYLGIHTGLLALLFPDIKKKPFLSLFIIPAVWTALDFLVSFMFSGFPWVFPAYSQYKRLELIQITSITGVYGLTFYIVLINSGIFLLIRSFCDSKKLITKNNFFIVFSLLAVTGLISIYGKTSLKQTVALSAQAPKAKILLLQANISPDEKHDPDKMINTLNEYLSMSSIKSSGQYDLAVWPETALPFPIFMYKDIIDLIKRHADENGPQMIGTLDIKFKNNIEYTMKNRAVLFAKGNEEKNSYDKIHLVPFGEYIPLKKYFPFLADFIVPSGEFVPGNHNDIIKCGKIKGAVKICFEIIFPDLVRKQVKKGANLIVNMTNDAWFGKSSGPYQHLAISVFRAVENKRAIARCANTGISAHILPTGKIINQTGLFEKKIQNDFLPLIDLKTPYTDYGDFFAYICMIVLLSTGISRYKNYRKLKEN